ncbi:hypothetical protein TNCV_2312721 [Trichonephila clavipes]|nr:hypothetical protein TNCV_2312721 [Trichonephila clavipes]
MQALQDVLFICYKQSPDNAHSVSFSQHSSSQRLIEDETFNDSDIINNLINYEDGQEARFFKSGVVPARISSQSSHHCWRSPLPRTSALIQRDFGCVLGVQQTKQLPPVAKVDLVWQLGV